MSELQPQMAPESKASVVAIRSIPFTLPTGAEISHHQGTETRRLLRKAYQLAPHAPDVADSQARYIMPFGYHILRSEQKKGLNLLCIFAHSHPNAPFAWYHYAHWLSYCGHAQAAKEAISKAQALHPNDVAIGRAYREQGAKDK